MKELLSMAHQVDEADLGALTVSLSRRVLAKALEEETHSDVVQKRSLRELLSSRQSQALALALTDRAHRSRSAKKTVSAIVDVTRRVGVDRNMPWLDRVQLRALRSFGTTMPKITAEAMKARLRTEASPFVLDAERDALTERLRHARRSGRTINLNYLGEEILGEAEAQNRVQTYLQLLERDDVDALSVKISSVCSQVNLLSPEKFIDTVVWRLEPVFEKAGKREKLIYFDMEAFRDLDLTREVFVRLVLRPELLQVRAGIALQAYIPDTIEVVRELLDVAETRVLQGGVPLRLRLVKGANLAAEAVEASMHRLPSPIYGSKAEVDANFKRLLHMILRPEHLGRVVVGLGSHNLFDQCYGLLLAEHRVLSSMLQLEMLEGMAGSTGRVLGRLAGGVLIYAPAVSPENFPHAVSYLVRRLDENTGPENFLQSSVSMQPADSSFTRESQSFLVALQRSKEQSVSTLRTQDRSQPPPLSVRSEPRVFDNCSDTDWTQRVNRSALIRHFEEARSSRPIVASRIDGSDIDSGRVIPGRDPSRPGIDAYEIHLAGTLDIERALQKGKESEKAFAETPARVRALMIERAADELEKDRLRLVSLMVLDAGKRAEEADIEVSEAIDFARYYAQSYLEYEERYELAPRGLTVVTPPFNFSLAIPLGGCFGALVGGNPVLLKPAPETPLVARAAADCLWRAGIPSDALQLVICQDEDASSLIQDTRVRAVVLTGGSSTARAFLRMRPGLRLLAETGGKNGAYVAALSDREQAIAAIVKSAFGHAGQKCSALSVLVLEDEVYEDKAFQAALLDATSSLPVGSAWEPENFVTPLIREPEGPLAKILRGDEESLSGGYWLLQPHTHPDNPQLLSPGLLWGISPGSFAHQTELFGPVLSVMRARDLEEGLKLLNGTPYGLTAGFFGLSEKDQELFAENMDAGNLYVNRVMTGAVVGRQSFGGRKDSNYGPGAKAGGPGYVLQFCHVSPKEPPRSALVSPPGSASASPPGVVCGTEVVGEENWLRHQPAEVLIVIAGDADEQAVTQTREASQLAGATSEEVSLSKQATQEEVEKLRPEGPYRIRVVGTPSDVLVRVASEKGWTLLTDPVTLDVGLEVRYFVLEQAISVAYHRHGNTSLRELNPLKAPCS